MEEKTKEKFDFYNTVVTWACIIWAVVSIALIVYFSGLNQVTFAIMTFGQLFLVLGIILLNRKKVSGIVLIFTGISCVVIPAVNQWGTMISNTAKGNTVIPTLLSTAISVIGLAMLIVPGILEDMAKGKCKVIVKAECVDFDETKMQDGSSRYAPIYQYEFKGNLYTKCTGRYTKTRLPDIGSKMDLRINEFKPREVYLEASKPSKMIIYILGASFFISGLGMVLTILGI